MRVTCHSTGTEHSVYHQYTQAGLSIQTPMQQLLNYLSGHQDCFKFNWLLFSLKQIDVHNAASAWMFFFALNLVQDRMDMPKERSVAIYISIRILHKNSLSHGLSSFLQDVCILSLQKKQPVLVHVTNWQILRSVQ